MPLWVLFIKSSNHNKTTWDYSQPRITRIKRIFLELLFHISRIKMLAFLKLEKLAYAELKIRLIREIRG